MFRTVALAASTLVLGGCASTIGTFFNRPVVEDGIERVASTISLAADRRTVVVVTDGTNKSRFCAEPPPDTATGLKSELEASVKAKIQDQLDAEGSLKDKFETDVMVIADRTAALDAFRTGVYALCQYHLNGAIAQGDVKPLFETLIAAYAQAHKESTFQQVNQAVTERPLVAPSATAQAQSNPLRETP